jgi:putative Holliday junction resolvase
MGRTLALDLGRARIGVAIDDELGSLAHPRGVLDARDRAGTFARLREIIAEEGVDRIIVGLPVRLGGEEGPEATQARSMAQAIADATGVVVEMWDERMTTMAAARALGMSGVSAKAQKRRIDEVAAVMILESWMRARKRRAGRG